VDSRWMHMHLRFGLWLRTPSFSSLARFHAFSFLVDILFFVISIVVLRSGLLNFSFIFSLC
jgi:hypothetical protein